MPTSFICIVEYRIQIRKHLSPLDYGHDYLIPEDQKIIWYYYNEELPPEVAARMIAARRHATDAAFKQRHINRINNPRRHNPP